MTGTVVHAAAMSTSQALAMARADIHSAVNSDTSHRRTQYALSARDDATTVLLEPRSTAIERSYAQYYFVEADTILAQQ